MTTRKARAPKPSGDTVNVTVIEPHLVFHDDEQRGGTLTGVPIDLAEYWERHGWVTIEQAKAEAKAKDQPAGDK